MKIKREVMIKALEAVRPGISAKEIVEQSTKFVFQSGEVMTFNDEIAVWYPLDLGGITGVVASKELHSLLSKIKDEEIEVLATDKELQIKGSKMTAGITMETEIRLPLEEIQEQQGDWIKLPEGFTQAVKTALPCAGNDMSKPVLTCVHIYNGYVEASDNMRIIRVDLGEAAAELFKQPIQIPASVLRSLIGYDLTHYSLAPNWCHFSNGKTKATMSCRTFGDKYPDVEPFFDVKGASLNFPSTTRDILDRASVFVVGTTQRDAEVDIQIANKKMTVKSDSETGWFEESTPCQYTGDPLNFKVNPSFLSEVLKSAKECVIGDRALKFVGSDFEHLVCLCV